MFHLIIKWVLTIMTNNIKMTRVSTEHRSKHISAGTHSSSHTHKPSNNASQNYNPPPPPIWKIAKIDVSICTHKNYTPPYKYICLHAAQVKYTVHICTQIHTNIADKSKV